MNQWVNISAPLPPIDTPVLALMDGNTLCAAMRVGVGGGWTWAISNGVLNNPSNFQNEDKCDITHWMPLPELPQRSEV